MREFIEFMKEILMIKEESGTMVGLSSFKKPAPQKLVVKRIKKATKEVKLSDLMRRA